MVLMIGDLEQGVVKYIRLPDLELGPVYITKICPGLASPGLFAHTRLHDPQDLMFSQDNSTVCSANYCRGKSPMCTMI